MKKLLALFVFSSLFIFSCCSYRPNQKDGITILEQKQENKQILELNSIVQIIAMVRSVLISTETDKIISYSEKVSHSTGVIYKKTEFGPLILTAAHVCDIFNENQKKDLHHDYVKGKGILENDTRFIIKSNDKMVTAIKIHSDQFTEVCILLSQDLSLPISKISHTAPQVGEDLFLVGFANGLWSKKYFPIFEGKYAGVLPDEEQYGFIMTIPSYPGASGGPIFNKNNEIVSLLYGFFYETHNLSLGTDLMSIISATKIADEKLLISGSTHMEKLKTLHPKDILKSWYD